MLCERVAVDTGILQPCPLRDIPCGLLPPESCPVLRTIETDVCKFWQCGLAQILRVASSQPFDWFGAVMLGLVGLVLLCAALTLVAVHCYRKRRGGHQDDVREEPTSPSSSEFETSSGSEFGSSDSPPPEYLEEQQRTSQPPPRPPPPSAPPQEPTVNYNSIL